VFLLGCLPVHYKHYKLKEQCNSDCLSVHISTSLVMGASAKGTVQTVVYIFTNFYTTNPHLPTLPIPIEHVYIYFLDSASHNLPIQPTTRELVKLFHHNTYQKHDIIQFFLNFYFVLSRYFSPYSKSIHYNPMMICSVLLDFF
jgi:hypothetical protein